MDDFRYKQIETETLREQQAEQGKFAFTGFGRSTDTMSAVDKVLAEAEKRKKQLSVVIGYEKYLQEAIANNIDVATIRGIKSDIAMATKELNRLAQEAAKRRAKVAEDLMGVGQKAEQSYSVKVAFKNLFKAPKSKFKLKVKKFKAIKTKGIEAVKPLNSKKGFAPIKSIKAITAIDRIRSFGSHTTLAGNNA